MLRQQVGRFLAAIAFFASGYATERAKADAPPDPVPPQPETAARPGGATPFTLSIPSNSRSVSLPNELTADYFSRERDYFANRGISLGKTRVAFETQTITNSTGATNSFSGGQADDTLTDTTPDDGKTDD